MAEDDPELNIRVTTESDGSGAEKSAKGLNELKKSAHETSGELRHLLGSAREGKEILKGIGAAASGGAEGVGEMVRGLKGLAMVSAHLLGAGPLGALVIALGLAAGAFTAMTSKAKEGEEGLKGAADEASKLAEELNKLKDAGEKSLKPLADEAKALDQTFRNLEERISAATGASNRDNESQRELVKSQRELAKAKELDATQDDTQRAYIEKKYTAQEHLDDANQHLIETTSRLNDLKVKQAAADDEAAQKNAIAAEAAQHLADAHAATEEAVKRASRATGDYETAQANLKKANEALSGAEYSTFTQALGALGRLPENHQVDKAQRQVTLAEKERADALKEARGAQAFESGVAGETGKLQKEADQANVKKEAADTAAEREQVAAERLNTAALNKVAAAILELKDIDKAKETGVEDAKEEKGSKTKETQDRKGTRITKAEQEQQAAADNHVTLAGEKQLERLARGTEKLHASATRHAEAAAVTTEATAHHLEKTSRRQEQTTRQVVNMSQDTSP